MQPAFLEWSNIETALHLSIVSWNIHGAKSKLLHPLVSHFLCTFDVIFLNEIQSPLSIEFPGYASFRGRGENMHRGGCALLIKNHLRNHISSLDIPNPEGIMLKLSILPNITLASCYVSPIDSPYHSFSSLFEAKQKMDTNPN